MNPRDKIFLSPKFCARQLDIFIVRTSILNAVKLQLRNFHGKLLDVGCGQMPYKTLLTSSPKVTQYIGLDLANNPIHDNQPDICWQDGKIPLAENSIQCAIATEVLEHCSDPETVVKEVNRVLEPGGLFFFTTPFLWPLHEIPYDEYRYTPFSLSRLLSTCGFVEIKLSTLGGWDASLAQMLGLWARNRPMSIRMRNLISRLLMPFIYLLYRQDKLPNHFQEMAMITGITGTARKIKDDSETFAVSNAHLT